MKKLFLFTYLFCLMSLAFSQSLERTVIASSGNFSTATNISLSSTIGELFVTTATSSNLDLTQGFQQPTTVVDTTGGGGGGGGGGGTNAINPSLSYEYTIYPNPFTENFIVESGEPHNLTFTIIDLIGQKIEVEPMIYDDKVEFDLSKESNGLYFLKIIGEDNIPIRTIKIEKI